SGGGPASGGDAAESTPVAPASHRTRGEYVAWLRRCLRVRTLAAGIVIAAAVATVVVWRGRATPRVPAAAHPACVSGPTTPGIDVSYFQQVIDWRRVYRAGIRFAFIRVSDGADNRDPMFSINWAEARHAGVARGAYQYFRPDQSALAQADLLIGAMRGRDGGADLPPVLDLEVTGGLPIDTVVQRARAWIDRVRSQLGVEPIVYTGGELWRTADASPLAHQPLWLAHYTTTCPIVPAAWPRWTFWQHTDHGAVPGIEGSVDLDVFAGTLGELRALR
ncbi:MAG TPA: GH25 family lysozyme, partial [Kofleriaceae bacterium]|nr:GH25 family lysozyme [Kofleriaceae bacterium]